MYKVWMDGVEIPNVMNVDVNGDRDIKEYNGIGKGMFDLADSRGLRSWVMKTEQVSPSLFTFLEDTLAKKEESRLVIVSEADKTSERVLLESYTKEESFAGVYNATLKFREYKPVGVRTTDVPYVARPGKIPEQPAPTPVEKGSLPGSVFDEALKETRGGGGKANKNAGAGRKNNFEKALSGTWYASDWATDLTDKVMGFLLGMPP